MIQTVGGGGNPVTKTPTSAGACTSSAPITAKTAPPTSPVSVATGVVRKAADKMTGHQPDPKNMLGNVNCFLIPVGAQQTETDAVAPPTIRVGGSHAALVKALAASQDQ